MIETLNDIHIIAASPKHGREPGDNSYNVSWAAVAVSAYVKVIGGDDEEVGIAIEDLLGDLMHLADAAGVDFDEALNKAEFNYDAEVNGE
uniref:MazG-like nucleotide pyrophosphohydrolase n=1 Tax=Mycobacterium phage BabyBack TaxID=3158877 RepID=A0AAU8GUI9_9CAUD